MGETNGILTVNVNQCQSNKVIFFNTCKVCILMKDSYVLQTPSRNWPTDQIQWIPLFPVTTIKG